MVDLKEARMTVQPVWMVLVPAAALLAVTVADLLRPGGTAAPGARTAAWARVLLAALAVVIGVRPVGLLTADVPVGSTVDVLVMVDRTASMGATDHDDGRSRLDGVAQDVDALVESITGANVALLVFDDDARVAVPFTTDGRAVASYVRTMGWRPGAKATGSDISVGVDLAQRTLDEAARARPGNRRYLVYAGDGEQTKQQEPTSFAGLAPQVEDAFVLGYGTSKGGVMPVQPGSTEVLRRDGEVPRSRADGEALRAIAAQTGGEYLRRAGGAPLPDLVPSHQLTRPELRPGVEHYWWLALAGVPLLLVLMSASTRAARSAREELHA
jgi:Ca-activated chloride channel family protein